MRYAWSHPTQISLTPPLYKPFFFTCKFQINQHFCLSSSMAGALSRINGHVSLSRSNPRSTSTSGSHRPMIVAMAQTQSYWASIESNIEAHLKKSIPIRPPETVFEPMHYLTFAAPKTTAASLCVAACELVGGNPDDAVAAASALHLVHAASFTHQHLPLTDRAKPGPTTHHEYGPNIELLTGDGIMPFGFELLGRCMDPARNNADKILRVIVEITRVAGSEGLVDGQYKEMLCTQTDGGDEACDADWMEYVCEKKEGALHACGGACGAILGGGSEEEIERLRKYGLYVGMIQGMLHGVGKNEKGKMEIVEKLRKLGLKELEYFKGKKVEQIASLVEVDLCSV